MILFWRCNSNISEAHVLYTKYKAVIKYICFFVFLQNYVLIILNTKTNDSFEQMFSQLYCWEFHLLSDYDALIDGPDCIILWDK